MREEKGGREWKGRKEEKEGERGEGRIEKRKGRENGRKKRGKGRKAQGKRGRKFGYRHHLCTSPLLAPGDETKIPTTAASHAQSTLWPFPLFQTPCDALGCTSLPEPGPVRSSGRKPFPTRCGPTRTCLLTYPLLERCLTRPLNH